MNSLFENWRDDLLNNPKMRVIQDAQKYRTSWKQITKTGIQFTWIHFVQNHWTSLRGHRIFQRLLELKITQKKSQVGKRKSAERREDRRDKLHLGHSRNYGAKRVETVTERDVLTRRVLRSDWPSDRVQEDGRGMRMPNQHLSSVRKHGDAGSQAQPGAC